MTANEISNFLLWCAGINYAILFAWFAVFLFAHEWLFRTHTRWFALSREAFDGLNYGGVAIYKIGIVLFFLVPALALYCSGAA